MADCLYSCLQFQHTATRRWLVGAFSFYIGMNTLFQHTATRRWLEMLMINSQSQPKFQHTAARRRLGTTVSGKQLIQRFNTQPPEGGCKPQNTDILYYYSFNTQPPEGGWFNQHCFTLTAIMFQHTAARRRLVWKDQSRTAP